MRLKRRDDSPGASRQFALRSGTVLTLALGDVSDEMDAGLVAAAVEDYPEHLEPVPEGAE